jgi:integrase
VHGRVTGAALGASQGPASDVGGSTIDLTPKLVHALKRWKLACSKGPLNLVFPNLDGSPRHRTAITSNTLRPALKVAGLRQVTLHSLRVTGAHRR